MKGHIGITASIALVVASLAFLAGPASGDHQYYTCPGSSNVVLVSQTVAGSRVEVGLYEYAEETRTNSGYQTTCTSGATGPDYQLYMTCSGCPGIPLPSGTVFINHINTKNLLP